GKTVARVLAGARVKPEQAGGLTLLPPAGKDAAPGAAADGRSSLGPEDQRARCVGRAEERFRWRWRTFDRHRLFAVRTDASERRRARRRARIEPLHHQTDDVRPSWHAHRSA